LMIDSPALLTDTTIADGDYIVFLDGGATGSAKKEALADLVGVMAGTVTSTGLSDANSVLKLDIQNMTASSTIADADLIVIDDGAGGTLRKMTRANLMGSAAVVINPTVSSTGGVSQLQVRGDITASGGTSNQRYIGAGGAFGGSVVINSGGAHNKVSTASKKMPSRYLVLLLELKT
jgi:hypothetical protein